MYTKMDSDLRRRGVLRRSLWQPRRAPAPATLQISDYLTMPMTGKVNGSDNVAQLTRINFMRPDPANANRFFVNDLNGPLYIVDKTTKAISTVSRFQRP